MAKAQKQNNQKRVPWSRNEDERLSKYMKRRGETGSWKDVPNRARLNRCGKSCRLRWINYLRPGIKRGPFSEEEVATIIQLQKQHGNKWAFIARHMQGRMETLIKNFWNALHRKKLSRKETLGLFTQTPLHQLLDAADLLTCAVNDLRDKVLKLHSDASFTWNPRNGRSFYPTDEELVLTFLPPQTPSFNYQPAMEEDPQDCTRNPDGIDSRPASIPNASSIPAPVSASLEPSKADQVVEIVEVTPADQEIDFEACPELHIDNKTSDCFYGDISLLDADELYNIIN